MPALNSLYFWTDERPPTTWYNQWFFTLDTAQQSQVIQLVNGPDRSRFCVVDNEYSSEFGPGPRRTPTSAGTTGGAVHAGTRLAAGLQWVPTLRVP